ncbi:MAG: ATP-binding cassette domain-containing protein [Sulfurovum sp.]|nr:ATP-binding cassette domain-containing protein [Sulfurovum sp.]
MLELKHVSKAFGSHKVLEDINLEIQEGEIISLLGKSGSGKSTILNIIAGFEEADKGCMEYQNRVIFSEQFFCEPQNRDIGFVFQNYALFPHLTLAKNIAFGISAKPKSLQKLS